MTSFKVGRFPFVVRQGMSVAQSIASGRGKYVSMLGLRSRATQDGCTLVEVRYEGGMKVAVELFNNSTDSRLEDWAVVSAELTVKGTVDRISTQRLRELHESGGWYHPRVMAVDEITGTVGVFVDRSRIDGFVVVDPDNNQIGHYTLSSSLPYRILVAGDLKAVKELARLKLVEDLEALL